MAMLVIGFDQDARQINKFGTGTRGVLNGASNTGNNQADDVNPYYGNSMAACWKNVNTMVLLVRHTPLGMSLFAAAARWQAGRQY